MAMKSLLILAALFIGLTLCSCMATSNDNGIMQNMTLWIIEPQYQYAGMYSAGVVTVTTDNNVARIFIAYRHSFKTG